ncbi:helix-turn-helix domain-containing protein [Chloroflexota bacterium]
MTSRIILLERLGKSIRSRRLALGISQEELGNRANLDRTYVSGVERGVRNPSFTALVKLSEGLGISLSSLLEHMEDQGNSLHG